MSALAIDIIASHWRAFAEEHWVTAASILVFVPFMSLAFIAACVLDATNSH